MGQTINKPNKQYTPWTKQQTGQAIKKQEQKKLTKPKVIDKQGTKRKTNTKQIQKNIQ